ncbi:hypothetical protein EVAR_74245_1 [Eumeta japonica]|uniref:Uncharacterized protein n=1 Tax=Eumeta variegata TaxID=151549 RepID=A0A4C1SCF5_EUMVA|nr:hypothetical protein EVAR_74245_1 [Eumeta japonica]
MFITVQLSRSGTPMNKVTTTVKTYTYEVPADQDPTTVPLPPVATHETTYLSTNENLRSTTVVPPAPSPGCQYCTHCNSRLHTRVDTRVTSSPAPAPLPVPPPPQTHSHTTTTHYLSTSDDRTNERIVYPRPANDVHTPYTPHSPHTPHSTAPPQNGHGPYSPSSYKYSETTYSRHDTTERYPANGLSPVAGSPAPFPRPTTPSPGTQQPPKQLDDLLADFPDARYPSQPDGLTRRKVEVTHESSKTSESAPAVRSPPIGNSRNVAGPGVYYPPGHTPFAKKETAAYQASVSDLTLEIYVLICDQSLSF